MRNEKHREILWNEIILRPRIYHLGRFPAQWEVSVNIQGHRYCAQDLVWTAVCSTSGGGKLKQKNPN